MQTGGIHRQRTALPMSFAPQRLQDGNGRFHIPQPGTVQKLHAAACQHCGCQNGKNAVFGAVYLHFASQTFSGALLDAGVPATAAAAMLHAGGTVFDALPHGSFFHATAGAVGMGVKDRLRLFPFGELVGATTTVASVLVYMIAR